MSGPEVVRRMKSYSAASGYVYQYYFTQVEKTRRGFTPGRDYIYTVSVDRKNAFPLRVFVSEDALRKWTESTGRELTGTEEYALAKMRLFAAFDEHENLAEARLDLRVDESNLPALLEALDI